MVGSVLIVMALLSFLFMRSIALTSNDPAHFMQTVGTVSGVVTGIGVLMIIAGLIGKRA
jgi:hypothetical protein